jgi:hypothetical protein
MKKSAVLAVIMFFLSSAVTAHAGGAAEYGGKGKPLSKTPGKGTFQAAADHIACWGKSVSRMKQQSLRGTQKPCKKKGTEIE